MFRSKVEVDRHVARSIGSLKTPQEKNIRSYSIARLYFDVGDYESCCRYVNNYLSVKDDNPAAHVLLGQALCCLGRPRQALTSYQTALTLDPSQNNLILKVCELLALDSVPLDIGSAKYWIDRAASSYPNHKSIFNLKQKILQVEGAEPDTRMELLEKEVTSRPHDSNLQARFLKSVLENKGALDAFNKASNIQYDKNRPFKDTIKWCETVLDVLNLYKQQNNFDFSWSYILLKLTILEKLVELYLGIERSPAEAENILKQLDVCLHEVSENAISSPPSNSAIQDLISHFSGQFCLHAACLILKRAPRDAGGWRESTKNAAPLLLLAYQAPPLTTTDENIIAIWKSYAADRRCQAGYTLISFFRDRQQSFTDKIAQVCSGSHWRDKLFRKLFNNRDSSDTIHSYFLTSNTLQEPQIRLPHAEDLKYDGISARKLRIDSLHHIVWHGTNLANLSELDCSCIESIPLSINNLPNCGAQTLNRLDMEAFLYCTVLTVKSLNAKTRRAGHLDPDRPTTLPIAVTEKLCTPPQIKWWEYARAICNDDSNINTDSRVVLNRGIETVRCSGGHGLDPVLISDLARIFEIRKNQASDNTLSKFLDSRATLYYTECVLLLEKIRDKTHVKFTGRKLFDFSKELSPTELNARIEEGKLYLATKYISENDCEKAVEILESVKSPYASFNLYKLYKKFADEDSNVEDVNSHYDMPPRRILMLTKARDNLYVTMERLKLSKVPINDPIFDNLEGNLRCIDLQLPAVDNQPSPNPQYSSGDSYVSEHLLQISRRQDQMELPGRNSMLIENLEDQIKQLVEANKNLVIEVRKMKKEINEIKNTSFTENHDKFKKFEFCMDEIKHRIGEYRDENASALGEIKDEISELGKGIDKLKLDKRQDDNDLFLLEEENFAANANSVNAGLSYLQRNANSQPYGLFQTNPMYPLFPGQYPGMSLFPGALLPQDQTLYQDLLLPSRSLAPQPPQPQLPMAPPTMVPPPVTQPKQATHNYQIPLPTPIFNTITSAANFSPVPQPNPNVTLNTTTTMPLTSTPDKVALDRAENPLSYEQPISLLKPFSFLGAEQSVSESGNNFGISMLDKSNASVNKSRTLSEKSTDSYDPMPDFKPIIELPEKVDISTGEENEDILFNERAKLYRLTNTEWKERGVGQMKLLKNKSTGVTRVLMRREQVHKICANHIITQDMIISPKVNTSKAYCWIANDFADQELKKETLTVRFSTVEIGNKFFDIFCKAIRDSTKTDDDPDIEPTTPQATVKQIEPPKSTTNTVNSLPVVSSAAATETSKPNPFSGFSFGKTASPVNSFSTPALSTNTTPSIFSVAKTVLGPKEKILFDKSGDLFTINNTNSSKTVGGKATGTLQVILNEEDVKMSRIYFTPQSPTLLQCNHKITETMKFENLNNQNNSITWSDASLPTIYAFSFGSKDLCEQFKSSVTEMQNNILNIKGRTNKNVNFAPATKPDNQEKKNEKPAISAPVVSGWGDKFKPKAGSWDCKSCYINNEASAIYCIACESPKDSTVPKKENKSIFAADDGGQKFTFGIPPAASTAPTTPLTTSTTPAIATKTSIFSMPSLNSSNTSGNFSFGMPKTSEFSFNAPTTDSSQTQSTFASDGSKFNFVFKPKAVENVNKSVDSDNEYASEDDGDHLNFKPVIALPAKVEVKTGEEDEDLIHSVHAKLYKFVKPDWKECGVGDIKLLKHKATGKYRVMMRRDVVLKVCLNFILNKDTEFTPREKKAWTFLAIDYSSEVMEPRLFCVSFQNKDIAQEYIDVINKAKADMDPNLKIETPKEDNDVLFVSELKASNEQIQRARKLQLPDNFYLYEQKASCPGCVGCNDDNFVIKCQNTENTVIQTPTKTPEEIFKQFSLANSTPPAKPNIFGGMVSENKNIFSSYSTEPASQNTSTEPKPVSMFSGTGVLKQPIFSPSSGLTSDLNVFAKPLGSFGVPKDKEKTSIFGGSINSNENKFTLPTNNGEQKPLLETKSIFGGFGIPGSLGNETKSIFGNPANLASESKTIFGNPVNLASESKPIFGNPASLASESKPIFGNPASLASESKPIFGNPANLPNESKPIFGSMTNSVNLANAPSFVQLSTMNAKNGEQENKTPLAFGSSNKDGGEGFSWPGAGTSLFSRKKQTEKHNTSNDQDDDETNNDENTNDDYDPHFNPIVPLPPKIEVVTGEEDEKLVFKEPCSLYRMVEKEWKVRGNGEVKILFHPQKCSYRLILRWDKLFKVVLNQLIGSDFHLDPLLSDHSQRSLMWGGLNYTEDNPEGIVEKLAIRFGQPAHAEAFKSKIEQIKQNIINNQHLLPDYKK